MREPWPPPPGGFRDEMVDEPRSMSAALAAWLVLMGGLPPLLGLVVKYAGNSWVSPLLVIALFGVGVGSTLRFGYVLGRRAPTWSVGGCAVAGSASLMIGFVVGYAMTPNGDSTDDSGALGVMFLSLPTLAFVWLLLLSGSGVGKARSRR